MNEAEILKHQINATNAVVNAMFATPTPTPLKPSEVVRRYINTSDHQGLVEVLQLVALQMQDYDLDVSKVEDVICEIQAAAMEATTHPPKCKCDRCFVQDSDVLYDRMKDDKLTGDTK